MPALGPSSAAQVAWRIEISEDRRWPEALPGAVDGDERLPHDLRNRKQDQQPYRKNAGIENTKVPMHQRPK